MCLSVVLLILVNLLQTAGSPVSSLFSQTGGSVTLEFQQQQQLERESMDLIQWYFGQHKIMKYLPHQGTFTVFTHKGRVEFNNETFSVELKNLQKNDSGLYRGEIHAGKTDVKVEHKLSVLDPVEAPVLSVVSNWFSSDSCNVTVICRGHDLSLNTTCNNITCSPEQRAFNDSTLTFSVRDSRIICDHKNRVSWRNVTMEINQLCPLYLESTIVGNPVWIVWFSCGFGACCAGLFWCIRKRKQMGAGGAHTDFAKITVTSAQQSPDPEASIYSTVQDVKSSVTEESPYDEVTTLTSVQSATSVYSMLQPTS
ncbi:hypothetical protein AALO_G00002040 [Alosa alosa]|uniref:Immunoglobulin V-set domain-containing protein n=1 Tax=Alosa alosa TaxID=278164 RepID=A0AAV6HDA4_9TELE|nr:CD48 antigen-like [Alosa alosa]KAG5285315.1 hypothetical protein AALO_G00002040 [Alosa alosa]